MMKKHIAIVVAVGAATLLAACSEPTPDISGTYSENTKNFLYTYTFSKFVCIAAATNFAKKLPILIVSVLIKSRASALMAKVSLLRKQTNHGKQSRFR